MKSVSYTHLAKIKGTDKGNDLAVIAVQKSDIPEDTPVSYTHLDVYKRQGYERGDSSLYDDEADSL